MSAGLKLPDDLHFLAERVLIDRNETHQSLACSREQVLKSGGANILDDPLPPAHFDQLPLLGKRATIFQSDG